MFQKCVPELTIYLYKLRKKQKYALTFWDAVYYKGISDTF